MEIRFGRNFKKETTFQEEFEETLACPCGGTMTPAVQVADDEGNVAKYRPEREEDLWIHDCAVFVIYLCTSCLNVTVRWNQA